MIIFSMAYSESDIQERYEMDLIIGSVNSELNDGNAKQGRENIDALRYLTNRAQSIWEKSFAQDECTKKKIDDIKYKINIMKNVLDK